MYYVYNFLGIKPEQEFVSPPLKPGKHTLWVKRAGYEVAQKEIEVQPGTATAHNINLDIIKVRIPLVKGNSSNKIGLIIYF